MKILILSLIAVYFILDLIFKYLTYKNLDKPVPDNVKDVYNEEKYLEFKAYTKEKLVTSFYQRLASFVFTMLIFSLNLHVKLFEFTDNITSNSFIRILFIVSVILILDLIISIPFDYYDTFKTEGKYGFNRTTKGLYIKDNIIKLILVIILQSAILLGLESLFEAFNNIYIFLLISLGVLAIIMLLIPFIYPLVSRLFNKMTPIVDGSLKDKINDYTNKVNFPVERIYTVDASKRSSKSNAFFLGFGKKRRIVLYDTLLEQASEEEIVAILAHEAGHAKHKDMLRGLPLSFLVFAIYLSALFFLVSQNIVSTAFGFNEANFIFGTLVFLEIAVILSLVLGTISNTLMRKREYLADHYAKTTYSKEHIISALKLITSANLSDLSPHPLVVFTSHNHPSLSERITALMKSND